MAKLDHRKAGEQASGVMRRSVVVRRTDGKASQLVGAVVRP